MTAEAYAANEIQGHTDEVLALALSSDGKLLASGGKDRRIGVWDAEKNTWIRSFGGHRDTISVRLLCPWSSTSVLSVPFRLLCFVKAPERYTLLPSIEP